jgi:hypothetical protein
VILLSSLEQGGNVILYHINRTFLLIPGGRHIYSPYLPVVRESRWHISEEALPRRSSMMCYGECGDVGHMGYPFGALEEYVKPG